MADKVFEIGLWAMTISRCRHEPQSPEAWASARDIALQKLLRLAVSEYTQPGSIYFFR